ncbi:MAG: DUF2877 domain-containing protein [Nitrospira sp.]|nr:DUF2877 domain-containing protein [Nitrospira sp.]
MHVQALSIGIQVPPHHFSGTVHSVFRQACNIRIEPQRLLTLLPSEKGNVPHGIRLHTPSQPAFLDLFRVGQPVACRGGILRTDGSDFSVDLRTARLWHIDLQALYVDLGRPIHAQSWAVAWSELKTYHRQDGLPGTMEMPGHSEERSIASATSKILMQQVAHTLPALLRATNNLRLQDAVIAMRPLIGLGPGLTPSGDDFLVGYLTGLWCRVGNVPSRKRFLTGLGSELSQAARTTNQISCAYLRGAASGHVSEPIATLAQQLTQSNDMGSVRAATLAALQIGHTSGSDGVLGLLWGCLVWQPLPCLFSDDLFRPSVYSDSVVNHEILVGACKRYS